VKVFVYVEGDSDRLGLDALLSGYKSRLRAAGVGMPFIVLGNKDAFFRKFAARAAGNLAEGSRDSVVALPDLYPNAPYTGTPNAHCDLTELASRLDALVRGSLTRDFGVRSSALDDAMSRFHASALKHDLEMLLLAAWPRLGETVRDGLNPNRWCHPVENQDQGHPPKRIIEEIFLARTGRAYRDTMHAPAVLRRVSSLSEILYGSGGAP